MTPTLDTDVAIVGAGAAGLATAIFTRRQNRSRSVVLIEGAKRPGAKILISGGGRCNLTNTVVTERDFWGGRSPIVRRVLRAFPVEATVDFFRELRVPVHEEADGKLFPDSNQARDVLEALLRESSRVGATLMAGRRVLGIEPAADGFRLTTTSGLLHASRVVLATGGQSLPKSGSNGAGFEMARQLGHSIVPPTPGLAPLVIEEDGNGTAIHRTLAGVSHQAELTIWVDGVSAIRLAGALLWTHVGVSGPVAMNASRHWLRARLEERAASITLNLFPGESFDLVDQRWTALAAARPLVTLENALATMTPASVAAAIIARLALDGSVQLAHLAREDRRRLVHALVAWPLSVTGTRGYNYAEVTAGGVSLGEIDPSTMESRQRRGLYLVGEILDVDGRIGGFNFQWAWASAYVAGVALGRD
jgi:predicted Rossmann fold flavoprotein